MQLSRILFRNPGTKLLALAIACATWFVLSGQRRERISERSYRIPLSVVNVPAGTMIVSPLPDAVDVRMRGAFTPLRSLEPGKLEAVIDLADAVPGEKRYPLAPGDINVPQEVEVIAIAPAEIRFVLDAVAEKTVPIVAEITGEPAPGAHLDEVAAEPRSARIIGPAKTLARIVTLPTEPGLGRGPRRGLLRNDDARAPGAGSAGARRTGGHGAGPDPAGGPARADAPADAGPRQKGKDVKLFGTDGLRGKAGDFPLDPASVRLLGRELGKRLSGGRPARVVVGGDTRESTPRIVADLAAGLAEGGCNVAAAGDHHDAGRRGARPRARRGGRRRGLRLAQPLRGQRHQDLRPRRPQVARRGGGVPREASCSRRARRRARRRRRRRPTRIPASSRPTSRA